MTGGLRRLRRSTPTAVWSAMPVGSREEEFWTAETVARRLSAVFAAKTRDGNSSTNWRAEDTEMADGREGWPRALAEAAEQALAMDALGGAVSYLQALGQDEELLSLRRFEHLHGGEAASRRCLCPRSLLEGSCVLGFSRSHSRALSLAQSAHARMLRCMQGLLRRAFLPKVHGLGFANTQRAGHHP